MTDQTPWNSADTLPWKKKLTPEEYYEFNSYDHKLIIQTEKRIGEAVPYYNLEWDNDDLEDEYVLEPRWANDSCDCCWYEISDKIQFWMPLPQRQEP